MPYFAGPGHHLTRGLGVLHRAEADLAEQLHAGGSQFLEVVLDHAVLDDGRTGMHLHPRGPKGRKSSLRGYGEGFEAERGRPGVCTSPADIMVVTPPCRQELIQPSWFCRGVQSPATGWTWLSMRPGTSAEPFASIVVVALPVSTSFGLSDRGDAAVLGDDGVGAEDRIFNRAREHQADVADDQPGRLGGIGGSVMGHATILFVD